MTQFTIYRGHDDNPAQCWRWRLTDGNHQCIATGGEAFTKDGAVASLRNLKSRVNFETRIVQDGGDEESGKETRFAYYEGNDGQFYWRLQNQGNNEIIAIGHEGFSSRHAVIRSIENVRQEIANQPPHVFDPPEADPDYRA